MKTVGDISLRETPVVEPSTALDEATRIMRESPLRTVVLVGDEQFMGVFNEAALESNLVPSGIDRSEIAVGPYTHPVRLTADPATPLDYALAQMRHRHVEVLPVVRGGVVYLGVVTREDLEKA